jgi:predicted nucleotidyltransferase
MNERFSSLAEICRRFGVAVLYVFGSRATEVRDWLQGQHHRLARSVSDVDIGILPLPDLSWGVTEKVRFAIALEDFLDCDRVDLVYLPEADPFLAAEVVRGERLFAGDKYAADEYDLYVLRRAGDLAFLERERMALVLGEPA